MEKKKSDERGESEGEKWVHYLSVDHTGSIPLRASTGVWKASLFIISKYSRVGVSTPRRGDGEGGCSFLHLRTWKLIQDQYTPLFIRTAELKGVVIFFEFGIFMLHFTRASTAG